MRRFLLLLLLVVGCAQAPSTTTTPGSNVRIAVVLPSATDDLAWSQSMVESLNRLKELEPTLETSVSDKMVNVSDAAAALRDYADQGYDLVIAHGTQYGNSMFEVAADYPEVSFAWGTATDTGEKQGLKNVFAYEAASEQGGYLNGLLAASLTKKKVVGIVGPVEAGDARLYNDAFQKGVKAGDPAIKVLVTYTGSFSDTALAAEAANVQVAAGADVLTGSSQQSIGALSLARERKLWWLATQTDQTALAPEQVAASQVFDWTPILQDMLAQRRNGKNGEKAYRITLQQGLTMVYNPKVTVPQNVLDARQNMLDGKL